MTIVTVTAAELKVGDIFAVSGGCITSVEAYTLPGYNVDYVRTMDTGMRTCMGAHWPATTQLKIIR
jgi:hypothetical protein